MANKKTKTKSTSKTFDREAEILAAERELESVLDEKSKRNMELTERMMAGDKTAKDELIRYNLDLVYATVWHFIKKYFPDNYEGNSSVLSADDLIQVGSQCLITSTPKYNPKAGAKFSTYIINCVNYCLMDECKKAKLELAVATEDVEDSEEESAISEDSNPLSQMLSEERQEFLKQMLSVLDEKECQVIIMASGLYGGEKLPVRIIAKKLNMPELQVNSLIRSAREKMRANKH